MALFGTTYSTRQYTKPCQKDISRASVSGCQKMKATNVLLTLDSCRKLRVKQRRFRYHSQYERTSCDEYCPVFALEYIPIGINIEPVNVEQMADSDDPHNLQRFVEAQNPVIEQSVS